MHSLKLPFQFDASQIRSEIGQFSKVDYYDIYNPSVQLETLWSINLIIPIADDEKGFVFHPTENLKKCLYLLSVFQAFQCSVETFRIHALDSGASIMPHRDAGYSFEHGKVRLHIPIKTNDKVEILLEGHPVKMKEGECWYCNFDVVHEVHNKGQEPRIHLIIDCMVNEWLTEVFRSNLDYVL